MHSSNTNASPSKSLSEKHSSQLRTRSPQLSVTGFRSDMYNVSSSSVIKPTLPVTKSLKTSVATVTTPSSNSSSHLMKQSRTKQHHNFRLDYDDASYMFWFRSSYIICYICILYILIVTITQVNINFSFSFPFCCNPLCRCIFEAVCTLRKKLIWNYIFMYYFAGGKPSHQILLEVRWFSSFDLFYIAL